MVRPDIGVEFRPHIHRDMAGPRSGPRHQATPAHTRSMGPPRPALELPEIARLPGALALIAQAEDFEAYTAEHLAPIQAPDLPMYPASQLRTPATHAEAHAGEDRAAWAWAEDSEFDGLLGARTFGLAEDS